MSDEDRESQDDEIFAKTRLINCGWFMQVILGDYVGAILGLVRDGLSWRLDPLAVSGVTNKAIMKDCEVDFPPAKFRRRANWIIV